MTKNPKHKEKKKYPINTQSTQKDIETSNRYDFLIQQPETSNNEIDITANIPKPPPVFVHGALNYSEMIKRIQKIAEEE
jgi:hypothetical protein